MAQTPAHKSLLKETMTSKYGERLLPVSFDEIARSNPSRLYATVAKSQDVSDGFQDLSFAEVARCVDNCARRLDDAFGCSEDNETVAYLGLPDLRTAIVFLAAVQCGYKACYLRDEG
ncbi:MAG: hypothetical protein Q9177_005358 [Variospora cf. flavescens]